jgi:hypothetical protein
MKTENAFLGEIIPDYRPFSAVLTPPDGDFYPKNITKQMKSRKNRCGTPMLFNSDYRWNTTQTAMQKPFALPISTNRHESFLSTNIH